MSPLALDVVTKTGKTPVLGRMLSKYVGRKTSSIENDITKARNHSRQRGNIMRVVFGIDVSKASSEVAILINGEKVHGYTFVTKAAGSQGTQNGSVSCIGVPAGVPGGIRAVLAENLIAFLMCSVEMSCRELSKAAVDRKSVV